MVWKPGSKHSDTSSRVIARRNDWNSICALHQGPRSMAASRGRIHDRSPIACRNTKKALAERGPSIHDVERAWICILQDGANAPPHHEGLTIPTPLHTNHRHGSTMILVCASGLARSAKAFATPSMPTLAVTIEAESTCPDAIK